MLLETAAVIIFRKCNNFHDIEASLYKVITDYCRLCKKMSETIQYHTVDCPVIAGTDTTLI
jgi:hypothetical protein